VTKYFKKFWPVIVGLALLAEGTALALRETGDTLSEWTWSKIPHGHLLALPLRMALGGLLVWLIFHFLWNGPGRGLHKIDLVFALTGALVGLLSYFLAR
jgi:hypothetical protein